MNKSKQTKITNNIRSAAAKVKLSGLDKDEDINKAGSEYFKNIIEQLKQVQANDECPQCSAIEQSKVNEILNKNLEILNGKIDTIIDKKK